MQLAEDAGGRGGGRQPALAVEADATNRTVRQGAGGMVGFELAGACKISGFVGQRCKALTAGECASAVSGQHDVRRPFHDGARHLDRIGETAQRRDGAYRAGGAVHQAGVEFVVAGSIGRGALAGDIKPGIFERAHHGGGDIEAAVPGHQPALGVLGDAAHMGDLDRVVAAGLGAGPAMQGKGNHRELRFVGNGLGLRFAGCKSQGFSRCNPSHRDRVETAP